MVMYGDTSLKQIPSLPLAHAVESMGFSQQLMGQFQCNGCMEYGAPLQKTCAFPDGKLRVPIVLHKDYDIKVHIARSGTRITSCTWRGRLLTPSTVYSR